jgi:hypothetical protein
MTGFDLGVIKPDSPRHVAGKHVSLERAWIEGVVQTGVREAIVVHEAPMTAAAREVAEPSRRSAAAAAGEGEVPGL